MDEIPINVWVGIQIQIGLGILPGFFTFDLLLVLIWLNSRFLNFDQFINN